MTQGSPRIWLIISDKLGDNAQVEVLAEKLGLPTERKELRFKERWIHGKPPFRASLYHIDLERSDQLKPPWPDLVITIGRRPAMAALWVKRQSGGRTRIVLIGRPKRYFKEFDLVIVTGQYRVPGRPNVLKLDLPLMRADPGAVAQVTAEWKGLTDMPRPLTAVLVGGATKPFRFTAEDAKELLRQVRESTSDAGSLYITTSRRTSAAAADALEEALPSNARLFRWTPEAGASDNPYLALLGSADRFVVTGDSISMMMEVARLGRPLAIAPLPYRGRAAFYRAEVIGRLNRNAAATRLMELLHGIAISCGFDKAPRDFAGFHARLYELGLAQPIAAGFTPPATSVEDSLSRAANAVHGVLAEEQQ